MARRISQLKKKAEFTKYANAAKAMLVKRALYKWAADDAEAKGLKGAWNKANDWGGGVPLWGGLGASAGALAATGLHYMTPKEKRKNNLLKKVLLSAGIGGLAAAGGKAYLNHRAGQNMLGGYDFDKIKALRNGLLAEKVPDEMWAKIEAAYKSNPEIRKLIDNFYVDNRDLYELAQKMNDERFVHAYARANGGQAPIALDSDAGAESYGYNRAGKQWDEIRSKVDALTSPPATPAK